MYYEGAHSITFKDESTNPVTTKNTWTTWYLVPSTRPVVSQPNPNYSYVDIPGKDGSLDFTNYLIGRPTYSDRSGSFSFIIDNDHGDWATRKSQIATFLNGQKELKMILDDDPNYYYIGRFYMKDWSPGDHNSTLTIEYRVRPYKYAVSNGQAVMG